MASHRRRDWQSWKTIRSSSGVLKSPARQWRFPPVDELINAPLGVGDSIGGGDDEQHCCTYREYRQLNAPLKPGLLAMAPCCGHEWASLHQPGRQPHEMKIHTGACGCMQQVSSSDAQNASLAPFHCPPTSSNIHHEASGPAFTLVDGPGR
jgi:hypothetical protein